MIEDGAKLFSLPVICRAPDAGGFLSRITYAHSFGYCFAGSPLMGQNAYLGVVPLLANLVVVCQDYVPSAADVADYVHRYLLHTFDDFKAIAGKDAMFEVAMFGYCSRTKGLKAFHIEPTLEGGVWTLRCSERADLTVDRPLYLGSEKPVMMQPFASAIGSAAPGRPLSRMPRHVIEDCISEGTFSRHWRRCSAWYRQCVRLPGARIVQTARIR